MTHNDTKAANSKPPTEAGGRAVRSEEGLRTLKQAYSQGYPESAFYVQVPVDSRNSAIHNAYHSSLCPSSLFEPRHSSLKVVKKNMSGVGANPNTHTHTKNVYKRKTRKGRGGDQHRKEVTKYLSCTEPPSSLPRRGISATAAAADAPLRRASHPEFTVVRCLDACE